VQFVTVFLPILAAQAIKAACEISERVAGDLIVRPRRVWPECPCDLIVKPLRRATQPEEAERAEVAAQGIPQSARPTAKVLDLVQPFASDVARLNWPWFV